MDAGGAPPLPPLGPVMRQLSTIGAAPSIERPIPAVPVEVIGPTPIVLFVIEAQARPVQRMP